MRNIKRITATILAVYMLSTAVFAEETRPAQFKVKIDEQQNVSVTESVLITEKDNSALNVNVFKCAGDNQSLVYSGALGGFKNGAWSNLDFSGIPYIVIFNLSSENEYYCVVPVTDNISYTTDANIHENKSYDEKTIPFSNTVGNITTNMSLVYNGKYHENVLMPGQAVTVQISVTNNEGSAKQIVPYIVQYDLNGKLINLKQCSEISAAANATTTETITEDLSSDTLYVGKIFLWEKSSLNPMHSPIEMHITSQDYYADDFTTAETINLDKPLCGIINTNDDTDIIKIRPKETGLYAIKLDASSSTTAQLYNSEQSLLKTTSSNNKYLFHSLTKDTDYYIKFSGSANDSYTISPANRTAAENVLINSGETASIGTDDICNVYAFTPSENGTYIITAVDTTGVKASLYNSSYEYVSSSQTSDDDVSFRITNAMQAGETYYILVSSKTDSTANNYTLYVEQPLDVISTN